jgi:hypothetical protein
MIDMDGVSSDVSSSLESDIKILWICIPIKLLKDDERWVYESQKEGNPEQIVRSFIMRHPEIFVHPEIMDPMQTPEPTILGVEFQLEIPGKPDQTTYPDLILRMRATRAKYPCPESKLHMNT